MSKLILSFFEEEVNITSPKTLSDLFNQISKSFLLSLDDSKELILTYKDNGEQSFDIKDEKDYKEFLDKKISKIYLDISQDSKIYQNELKEQEEISKNKEKIEKLKKLEKDLEKSEQEKINEMNNLINKLGSNNANALIKNIHSIHNGKNAQQQKIRKEINQLKQKIEKKEETEPMKLKSQKKVEKKEEKKEETIKNNVHGDYICDGCDADPIVGIRYKCAVCEDFDYCEKCEKIFGEKHGHPFLKIRNSDDAPLYFNCKLKKNNK